MTGPSGRRYRLWHLVVAVAVSAGLFALVRELGTVAILADAVGFVLVLVRSLDRVALAILIMAWLVLVAVAGFIGALISPGVTRVDLAIRAVIKGGKKGSSSTKLLDGFLDWITYPLIVSGAVMIASMSSLACFRATIAILKLLIQG